MSRAAFATATGVFFAVLVYLLWAEHRAHLMGALPYALVLLCVGMHFFMHRGNGHGGGDDTGHHDRGTPHGGDKP